MRSNDAAVIQEILELFDKGNIAQGRDLASEVVRETTVDSIRRRAMYMLGVVNYALQHYPNAVFWFTQSGIKGQGDRWDKMVEVIEKAMRFKIKW